MNSRDPQACSVLRDVQQTSAVGTAAQAVAWVGLEQRGPWGRNAATESHLPGELGAELDRRVSAVGGRFALLRRPSEHDARDERARVVQLCGGLSPTSVGWLVEARLAQPSDLLQLDFSCLLDPEPDRTCAALPSAVVVDDPVLWVCTNGKRDVCCALRGRPVALAMADELPGRVWETTHLGGHRFAPTGVVLPCGVTLASMSVDVAAAALAGVARGQLADEVAVPTVNRGRSCLAASLQAAEHAVRTVVGERDLTALDLIDDGAGRVSVRHRDGRRWQVTVQRVELGEQAPVSCGKPAQAVFEWHTAVTTVQGEI